MIQRSEWPDFFPQGVPPKEATPTSGDAFRIVKSIPPSDSDFISTFEKSPRRTLKNDNIGKFFGTSFHRQLECSRRTRNRYPPLRQSFIVSGTLKNEHGVQLSTPSNDAPSHFTVWRRKQSLMHPDFTVNAEAT